MPNDAYQAGRTITTVGTYAGAGAAIGSVVPGVGTAVGAAGGAVVGGLVSLFGGGPEAQQHESNVGGRSIDARQIWEQIHPGSSTSVRDGADAANNLQRVHHDRAGQIDALNRMMDEAWTGDAGAQAQAGAHPLGIWLRDSASNLEQSSTYLNSQGDSFDTAKSQVQEISAEPPEAGFLDGINPFSDKDEEIEEYNRVGQSNVQAFNAYYQASMQNAASMPQYGAWEGNNISDGNIETPEIHKPGPGDDGRSGDIPPGGTGNIPSGTGNIPSGTGNIPAAGGNIPGGGGNLPGNVPGTGNIPGPGNIPGTGNVPGPGGYQPNTPPGYQPGTVPGYQSPGWDDGTSTSGYTPPKIPSADIPGGGGGGFGPGGSGGFGPGGGASGGFGPGGSGAGAGPGAATGAVAPGSGSGAGTGGQGAAGGRGGAGMGRMGGMPMGGMAGGGRGGQGGGDEEHQNRFLIEEDPNSLFGSDELTTPPVIGE
ncbi:hypothetical protein [Amycolatopsis aidingensis]|uniref:hypothetical protein n=1 Tax=Amycolatopsis aidingensis TaxID=2842453 RepID=UPI001C0AA91E|nr:hypothetical protein [Amycolatopsis aidingensis]